jgi:thiamine-phosphate pyrophosphorylase
VRLLFITDRHRTRLPLTEVVARAFEGGLRAVIVRERDLDDDPFGDLARTVSSLAAPHEALALVTNRVQVAVHNRLAGVHLGAGGPGPEEARALLGGDALIGLSVHSIGEVEAGRLSEVDYLIAAPIFATDSHPGRKPLGLGALSRLTSRTELPVFALGGIHSDGIASCLEAGSHGVAVIGAIAGSYRPREATAALLQHLKQDAR